MTAQQTYQKLVHKMKTQPSPETWQAIEDLKNSNGGMPPVGHTPGPWRCYNAKGGRIFQNRRIIDGRQICLAKIEELPGGESELANARLIAAAPDLLAALEAALVQVRQDNDDRGVESGLRGTEWQIRAAIAKAKGQAQ